MTLFVLPTRVRTTRQACTPFATGQVFNIISRFCVPCVAARAWGSRVCKGHGKVLCGLLRQLAALEWTTTRCRNLSTGCLIGSTAHFCGGTRG